MSTYSTWRNSADAIGIIELAKSILYTCELPFQFNTKKISP